MSFNKECLCLKYTKKDVAKEFFVMTDSFREDKRNFCNTFFGFILFIL